MLGRKNMNSINSYNRFETLLQKHAKMLSRAKHFVTLIGVIIVMLGVTESVSFIGVSLYALANRGVLDSRVRLEVYKDKEWAPEYFRELKDMTAEYYPYVGHRTEPNYKGRYINLDHESRRKTLFQCSGSKEDAIRIFMFGGSTLWGTGARDEGTIPSLLAKELCRAGKHVEVINFGESGFQSTQEMIRLLLELNKANTPDVVVFYDGVNDVFSSYQDNVAGFPQNTQNRREDFNSRYRLRVRDLWKFLPSTRKVVDKIREELNGNQVRTEALNDTLALETAKLYFNNLKIVKFLGNDYGFKSLFFWQPSLSTKSHLSLEEKNKLEHEKSLDQSYVRVRDRVTLSSEVINLTEIFDAYTSTIFIDWAHTTEEGNAIVAKAMATALLTSL